MNKARKRFVLFALLCVFVLLSVLLGIINGANFTMASEDADRVTQMLAQQRGMFSESPAGERRPLAMRNGRPQNMPPWGPDSPEMASSLRYFTFAFDESGAAERVAWQINAVTEEEALSWARSLLGEQETGWTGQTYRYRVYSSDTKTYVTVIDQSRELLSPYRILWISGLGLVIGLAVSCAALVWIGRRLFQPLEEAERRQKRFIADCEAEFKVPLTIINANTEIMEREAGETEQTLSINRQVKRMIGLVKNLSSLGMFDEQDAARMTVDLSSLAMACRDAAKARFEEAGKTLRAKIDQSVTIEGDSEAIHELMEEALENALKFSTSWTEFFVGYEDGHPSIVIRNDSSLADGALEKAFDRFTRLENAQDKPGAGLGLSHVKEIVQAHNGRASARAENGEFILRVIL